MSRAPTSIDPRRPVLRKPYQAPTLRTVIAALPARAQGTATAWSSPIVISQKVDHRARLE